MPVSEVRLDAETVERFRTGYRDRFGAVSDDDLLYAAISEGGPTPAWSTGCRCSTTGWRRCSTICQTRLRSPSTIRVGRW